LSNAAERYSRRRYPFAGDLRKPQRLEKAFTKLEKFVRS